MIPKPTRRWWVLQFRGHLALSNAPGAHSRGTDAGSAAIFTEALCHTGTEWTNTERDRLTLFTCYNTVNAKWGKNCISEEVIAAMPPLRQTLLRGAWHGMGEVPGINRYYDEANRAI